MSAVSNYLQIAKDLNLYVLQDAHSTFSLFHDPATNFGLHWQAGISHSVNGWAHKIDREQIFITSLPTYHDASTFSRMSEFVLSFSPNSSEWDPRDCFVVLCNQEDELRNARNEGFRRAIFCNQNSFLNWNLYDFRYRTEIERVFNLVLNCRPERNKRPFFAKDVDRLAIIKGKTFRPNEVIDLRTLNPWFLNADLMAPQQVNEILNLSKVGGIFSMVEGACFSSSEFLLCGLPVVSSPSQGGRAVWYDDTNSIIVDEPSEVRDAVMTLVKRCENDTEIRSAIRKKHIEMSEQMRNLLFEEIDKIAESMGVRIDFRSIFKKHYRNKMRRFFPLN